MIIEGNKRLTNLMQKVFAAEKFSVDVAHTGDLGVEIALRGVYDVIILDWMLPDRDGPSICQTICAAHVPVAILMLTARTQVEDRVAGLYSGADDYLVKPFSMARISALCARHRASPHDCSPTALTSLAVRFFYRSVVV